MSQITESDIMAMSKEQNYMTGYMNGTNDTIDRMNNEIKHLPFFPYEGIDMLSRRDVLEILNKQVRNKLKSN